MLMPIYETDRLVLRPFNETDVNAFHRMTSDPDIIRFIGTGLDPDLSHKDVLKQMRTAPLGDYEKTGYGRHAMVLKTTNEVIGFTGLKYLPEIDETDLGYRMFPEYWGNGLATESCWPMLDFAFQKLELAKIIGIAMPENSASCHVLEKVGLKFIDERELFDEWLRYYELYRTDYFSGMSDMSTTSPP